MPQEPELNPSPLLPPEPEETKEGDREIRSRFLHSLELEGKEELLFHFEMLLTAMDRFFHLRNHPLHRGRMEGGAGDLRVEVEIADRQLRRLVQMVERILFATNAQELMFRSYVETHLLQDHERNLLISQRFEQRSPLESLYLLLMGLRSLVFLCAGLLEAKRVEVPVFNSLGQQYMMLILSNRFFNPLRLRGFSPLWERVPHQRLQLIVRALDNETLRRTFSLVILLFFRYLRILQWALPRVNSRETLLDTLPWYTLLHSELRVLLVFFENEVQGLRASPHPRAQRLAEVLDTIGFQLSLELRKVYQQILRDFTQLERVPRLRIAVESAHGVLTNLLQQATLAVAQVFDPDLVGKELFPDFISRFEQSFRLRQDLWVLHEILKRTIPVIESEESDPFTRRERYHILLEFIRYFENFSFHFVRYSEHEAFQSFFEAMRDLRSEPFIQPGRCREIARSLEHFRIFLETVIGAVSQRAELLEHPLDREAAEKTVKEWLKEE